MKWIKAVGAVAALILIAVGPPILLLSYVGGPWPTSTVWNSELDDATLIKLLSLVVWLFWVQTVWCITLELLGAIRSTSTTTKPAATLGVQQHLARVLVGAIIAAIVSVPAMMVTSSQAQALPTATPEPTTSAPVAQDLQTADKAETPAITKTPKAITVAVQRGDSLWSLAQKHLGDGERWPEIAAANDGQAMTHGATFRAGEVIRPGWELIIPGGQRDQPIVTGDGNADLTVASGDTLSQIALDELGDASAWPEVFEASKDLDQPIPMVDPDLIYPGQHIDLPMVAEPSPQTETEVRTPTEPTPKAIPHEDAKGSPSQATNRVSPRSVERSVEPVDTAGSGNTQTIGASQDPLDESSASPVPGWVLPGLLGAGTLLAGAMLLQLRQRRASQRRSRRPGRLTAAVDPHLWTVEKSINLIGEPAANTVEQIDSLLKRLAHGLVAAGSALPTLAAVEVTPTAIALHLKEPSLRPQGWASSDDNLLWVVDRDQALADPIPADSPAPWPLLVTVGYEGGNVWLLNLEDVAATVAGDQVAVDDFTRFIAAELLCNPWSRQTSLDVVGVAAEVAPINPSRIRIHDEAGLPAAEAVAEIVRNIDRLTEYDTATATARTSQIDPDPWNSRLVIVDQPVISGEIQQLRDLITTHPGRTGTALISHLAEDRSKGFEICIDENRTFTIPAVNLTLSAAGLTEPEARGCASLLEQATDRQDTAAPEFEEVEGWRSMATTTGALRDQYRVDRGAATIEQSGTLLESHDDVYVAAAATTAEDLAALSPKVLESVRERVAESDPELDADLADWNDTACSRPRLTLLGPVEARTSGKAIEKRRPFYTELFAFLATRTHGSTTDEVAAAFNITPARVRADVNNLREWLGTNPTTGKKYLPDAREAPAAVARGVGVYQVLGALTDIDLFRRLRLRGEAAGRQGLDDLTRALQLVQGRPFDQLRAGGWSWLFEGDRIDQHLVCSIADVAHVLATHHLSTGQLDDARTAAALSLMAAPDEEIGRLDLAAVLNAQGHKQEAEKIIVDDVCNRSDDEDAPEEIPARAAEIIGRNWLQKTAI